MKKGAYSVESVGWCFFCLIFPLSAFINGSVPFLGTFGLYANGGRMSIRLAAFLIPLSIAALLWGYAVYTGKTKVRINHLHGVLLFLLIPMLGATVLATDRTVALFGSDSIGQGLFAYIGFLLCAFLASQFITSAQRAKTCMRVIVYTATIVAILALCEVMGIQVNLQYAGDWMRNRGIATFLNPDFLGIYLVIPAIFAGGLILRDKGKNLVASAVCFTLTTLSLMFTMTRGAWIGFLAGIIMLTVLHITSLGRLKRSSDNSPLGSRRVIGMWLILAIILILFATLFSGTEFTSRLESAITDFQTEGGALAGRSRLWAISADVLLQSPLFGVGADNILYEASKHPGMEQMETPEGAVVINSAHNMYLDFALNFGIIFALLLIVFIAIVLIKGVKKYAEQPYDEKRLSSGILLASWVSALFGVSISFITAVVNPAIMALFFCALGFLINSAKTKEVSRKSYRNAATPCIMVFSAGLLVFGLLEGASALTGNMDIKSPRNTLSANQRALAIAPWRKEPLSAILQATITLRNQDMLSDAEAEDIIANLIEKEQNSFPLYINMASILYDGQEYEEARVYVEKALELRPTLALAQTFLKEIDGEITNLP